jgi:hypothetical protein
MLCLLLGIGLTQLSAQNNENGNGAVSWYYEWDGYYIDVPVVCGQPAADRCVGLINAHVVQIFKNGELVKEHTYLCGEVTNPNTNEVFEVKDHWTYEPPVNPDGGTGHFKLEGSYGSHYVVFYRIDVVSWDPYTDVTTFIKVVCN